MALPRYKPVRVNCAEAGVHRLNHSANTMTWRQTPYAKPILYLITESVIYAFWACIHPLCICLSLIMQSYIHMCMHMCMSTFLSVCTRIAFATYACTHVHVQHFKHTLVYMCTYLLVYIGITLRTHGMYICFISLCIHGYIDKCIHFPCSVQCKYISQNHV